MTVRRSDKTRHGYEPSDDPCACADSREGEPTDDPALFDLDDPELFGRPNAQKRRASSEEEAQTPNPSAK
jgi:hypothetical protein